MAAPMNTQISSYSSLAGALTPTIKPYYELPQDVYHADACIVSSAGIQPIYFGLCNGTPSVRLGMLLCDLNILNRVMVDAMDRVFEDREGLVKVDLRVMWPGYEAITMTVKLNPATTTRAFLAQAIGEKIDLYMQNMVWIQSTLNKYQIGPNGIRVHQVLLRGIKHIHGDLWKAIINIDNSINV